MDENQNIDIGQIVEPDPIGFSFDAPGWGILLGILVLVLILIGVKRYLDFRKNKYRRIAIASIEDMFTANLPTERLVFQVAEILKRVSITSFGRSEVAHLNGRQWMEFLSKKNEDKPVFSPSIQKVFSDALYMGSKASVDGQDAEELKRTSLNWIKKHRV